MSTDFKWCLTVKRTHNLVAVVPVFVFMKEGVLGADISTLTRPHSDKQTKKFHGRAHTFPCFLEL